MIDQPSSIIKRAKDLYDTGKLAAAEELLHEAEEAGLDDPAALNFRAYLLFKLGRGDEAAESYRRLTEIAPTDPSHFSNLGLVYFKLENISEARRAFERVLAMRPGDEKARRNLDICLHRLGQPDGSPSTAAEPPGEHAGDVVPWMRGLVRQDTGERRASARDGVESLRWRIEEKVYLNFRYLASHHGVIVFSSASREARRAAGKFGDRGSELIRAEGNGEVVFFAAGRRLYTFRAGETGLCVNYPSLVCCGSGVKVAHRLDLIYRGSFLATELSGGDLFVLALRGEPTVLAVRSGEPVMASSAAAAAWTEGVKVDEESAPFPGRLSGRGRGDGWLRFEGEGLLLLQGLPVGL